MSGFLWALCWETLLLSWQQWLKEGGMGRDHPCCAPIIPRYPPAPRAAPAPQQLRPLCSSHQTLSRCPCSIPKASGRILPLTTCPVTTGPGDQFGVQRVALGAESKDLGYACGVQGAHACVYKAYMCTQTSNSVEDVGGGGVCGVE